ncbi:MAG: YgaP family membrane protein [Roseiflexus sp.]
MLPVNESVLDRDIRLGVGLLMFLFGFFGLTGVWQITLTVIAVLLILSAVTGFSLLYAVLRVNTAEHSNQ